MSSVEKIIKCHIDSTYYQDSKVIEEVADLLSSIAGMYIKNVNDETFYEVPYKEITNIIFMSDYTMGGDEFTNFCAKIDEELEKKNNNHINAFYRKFTQHIELAWVQKNYINRFAESTKEEAIKAKKMYDEMIVNYITILGIFASIIITVFGGIQIISGAVELLQTKINFLVLVFVLVLLTLLVLCILLVLIRWIARIGQRDYKFLEFKSFEGILLGSLVGIVILLFAIVLWNTSILENDVQPLQKSQEEVVHSSEINVFQFAHLREVR